jgi:hypothetical protein
MTDEPEVEPERRKVSGTVDADPGCLTMLLAMLLISALWTIGYRLSAIDHDLQFMTCEYAAAHGVLCSDYTKKAGK